MATSASAGVSIDAQAPDPPVLLAPDDGIITDTNALTLTWAASSAPDVAGYLLDWNGTALDVGNVTESTTGVLADGSYTWTLAAYDALNNTSAFTDVWSLEVDTTAPEPPILLAPDDGTVTHTTALTLTWAASPSPDAAGYLLDWNGTVLDVGNVTEHATGVLAEGVYTWTVAAYDALEHTSAYTDVWTLEVDTTAPDPPTLLGPPDGTITSTYRLTLTWAASPSPDVAGYLLDGNGTVFDVGNVTAFSTGDLANDVYTWTLAAYDVAPNTSVFTDVWSFEVDNPAPYVAQVSPAAEATGVGHQTRRWSSPSARPLSHLPSPLPWHRIPAVGRSRGTGTGRWRRWITLPSISSSAITSP